MERAMLSLSEGDYEQARHHLEEHARRFPRGLLLPERRRAEARLGALAGAGPGERRDDAAKAAGTGGADPASQSESHSQSHSETTRIFGSGAPER